MQLIVTVEDLVPAFTVPIRLLDGRPGPVVALDVDLIGVLALNFAARRTFSSWIFRVITIRSVHNVRKLLQAIVLAEVACLVRELEDEGVGVCLPSWYVSSALNRQYSRAGSLGCCRNPCSSHPWTDVVFLSMRKVDGIRKISHPVFKCTVAILHMPLEFSGAC